MKIGINARFLMRPFTGIFEQTKNLYAELAKLDKKNKYIFVIPEKVEKGLVSFFPKNVEIKILPENKLGTVGMKKTWWEQVQLPEFFVKEGVKMAIFPYPSNPWTSDWYLKKIKTVVCVHDCIPWTNANYRKGMLSKMYHHQSKKAVKSADLILTVSNSSKKEIVQICNLDKSKIKVIYNDADTVYKSKINRSGLKKHRLKEKKYFLYVGGYDERKNVEFLMREFNNFAKKNQNIQLVLAGGKLLDQKLYASFEKKSGKNVVRTGFLESSELASLYGNCLAYVNMSQKEGFNIPLLEAANCEAPLILSDIEVHREVAGDAAIFVDSQKRGALVKAMGEVVKIKVRSDFVKKSAGLAKKYSWQKSAKKLKDVLFS